MVVKGGTKVRPTGRNDLSFATLPCVFHASSAPFHRHSRLGFNIRRRRRAPHCFLRCFARHLSRLNSRNPEKKPKGPMAKIKGHEKRPAGSNGRQQHNQKRKSFKDIGPKFSDAGKGTYVNHITKLKERLIHKVRSGLGIFL